VRIKDIFNLKLGFDIYFSIAVFSMLFLSSIFFTSLPKNYYYRFLRVKLKGVDFIRPLW
jgi:hypothetical protein